jgi:HSP20 family molecular chaperone IbpA
MSMGNIESQRIPVNVYRSDERVTVAAPMPGMESQDIVVTLSQDVIQDEWNPGTLPPCRGTEYAG